MDDVARDRTLKKLRLDPAALADIVAILSRNDRRAIVKIDDHKLDDPTHANAAALAAAKTVDVVSFWVNPEHPHWGRRHFVYVASSPQGAQYFGDSMSVEVTRVLEELDTYFGRATAAVAAPAIANSPVRPLTTVNPVGVINRGLGRAEGDSAALALLAGVGVMIAVIAFFIGRWSVDPVVIVPIQNPASLPQPTPTIVIP